MSPIPASPSRPRGSFGTTTAACCPPLLRRHKPMPVAVATRPRLPTGCRLLARVNQPGVPDIASIPARERPVGDDFGVHDDLDKDVEQGDGLEILKFVSADLPQLGIPRFRIGELQQLFPHFVELIGLKHMRYPLA